MSLFAISSDQVRALRESTGLGMFEIKNKLENRLMRESVEAATTLKDLKPVLLTLIARQGGEL